MFGMAGTESFAGHAGRRQGVEVVGEAAKMTGLVTAVDVVPEIFGGESHSQGRAVCQDCGVEAPWRRYWDGIYLFCRCGDDSDGKDTERLGTDRDAIGSGGSWKK